MTKAITAGKRDAGLTKLAKVDAETVAYYKELWGDTKFADDLVRDIPARTAEKLVSQVVASLNTNKRTAATSEASSVRLTPLAFTELADGSLAHECAAAVVTPTASGPLTSRFLVQAAFAPSGQITVWKVKQLGRVQLPKE